MIIQMRPRLNPMQVQWLRQHLDANMSAKRSDRLSWWAHWAQLSENYLPRRYKWFVTPNQSNRGSQMNQNIIDETGLLAARTLASGMLSGLTSPTKPWFRLGLEDPRAVQFGPAKNWLAEVERRMLRVLQGSNFYTAMGQFYHDLAVFCSSAMLCYEDPADVVRFTNPCLGEFFFGSSARLSIDQFSREYTYTVYQTVQEFGLENCSESVAQSWKSGGASWAREVVICHAIEPNTELYEGGQKPIGYVVPRHFNYREVFWEQGAPGMKVLRTRGYHEQNFFAGRWMVTSNDAYGSGPGMDGLPAVRQLQIEQRRKGEAIDKGVRPPMVGHVSMKNEPKSILPGDVTYVVDTQNAGFKPAYQVDAQFVNFVREDIKDVQQRVNDIFFVNLFMMISQLDTVRTATEIDARREEQLIQLGPVIERNENEVLDKIINRVFGIMVRRGLLPPAPREIAGQQLQIQYISMLAEAQRATSTAAIERLLGLAGNLAGVKPEVLDNIDFDAALDEYADLLGVPPKLIVPIRQVMQIRQQRAQQQQAQQAAQITAAGVQGAQTLSQTKVGAGDNALDKILGTAA